MTLWFLGDVEQDRIPGIAKLLADHVKSDSPFVFRADKLTAFPDPVAPRVVVVACSQSNGDSAARLHDELGGLLERHGIMLPESRRWTPHITIGRVQRGPRQGPLELAPFTPFDLALESWCLFSSTLTPDGAVHEPIISFSRGRDR